MALLVTPLRALSLEGADESDISLTFALRGMPPLVDARSFRSDGAIHHAFEVDDKLVFGFNVEQLARSGERAEAPTCLAVIQNNFGNRRRTDSYLVESGMRVEQELNCRDIVYRARPYRHHLSTGAQMAAINHDLRSD